MAKRSVQIAWKKCDCFETKTDKNVLMHGAHEFALCIYALCSLGVNGGKIVRKVFHQAFMLYYVKSTVHQHQHQHHSLFLLSSVN